MKKHIHVKYIISVILFIVLFLWANSTSISVTNLDRKVDDNIASVQLTLDRIDKKLDVLISQHNVEVTPYRRMK